MQGTILDYNYKNAAGIISGADGLRYAFTSADWKSTDAHPKKETRVDFNIAEDKAIEVYALAPAQTPQSVAQVSTSVAAVFSLVFGLIGLFLDWWFFALPSIIAVITGHVARGNIRNSNGRLGGDGMAIAGLVLGYIPIGIYLFIVLFFAGLIGAASMQ